jgi:hypothetical protein
VHTLIPVWILGGPFVGLLILAFSFKGSSAMGGTLPRMPPRDRDYPREREHRPYDSSAPILEPMHPDAPRRTV